MKLTFIGATDGVTGSKTLLEMAGDLFLIDSGLYQEGEKFSLKNKESLPFEANKLKAIIITHAHLDHTGYLPFFYELGFRGPIYLTEATSKLARIILSDSAELMSEDDEPFYSVEAAHNVVSLFRPIKFHEEFSIGKMKCVFHRASHILGAAFVEINANDKKIVFSGDLGRLNDPILPPPEKLNEVDYLILESTYGGKERVVDNPESEIFKVIKQVKEEKLNLLVPCFALHRAQMLAYLIKEIFIKNPELKMPLYLNSPMMEKVTSVYQHFKDEFKIDFKSNNPFEELYFLNDFWEIEKVNQTEGPQIILASSGMITGGRIWTHLVDLAPKRDTMIMFPGFIASGTDGFKIANGEKAMISPDKVPFKINAKIYQSDAFSSHAEESEIIHWINSGGKPPRKIFLLHGEESSKLKLQEKIKSQNIDVVIPKKGEVIEI